MPATPETPALLDELAAAVADREAVDWERLRKRPATEPAGRRVAALEMIERTTTQASTTPIGVAAGRLPTAALAIVWLAALIVVVAVLTPAAWLPGRVPVPAFMVRIVALGYGAAGLLLVRAGRRDVRAVALGGFFLCVAAGAVVPLLPVAAPVEWIARPATVLATLFPDAFLAFFLWRFALEFPRRLHFGPADLLARWAARASAAVGILFFSANALFPWMTAGGPARALQFAQRNAGGVYWLCVSLLCLVAPFVAWRRARGADAAERARLRWFLGGLALGFSPLFLTVAAEALVPPFARFIDQPAVRAGSGLVLFGFLLTIPVTSSYAVIAHRVLALRVIVHRAAAFAFARGSLLLLAVIPSAGLLRHLHSRRRLPLESIFTHRTTAIWLAAALAAWALYAARRALLRGLETALIGNRRAAAPVLAEFTHAARQATSVEQLAAVTREHLTSFLATSQGTLLLRRVGTEAAAARGNGPDPLAAAAGEFVAIDGGLPPLPGTSGIVQVAVAGTVPVPLDDRGRGRARGRGRESWLPWLLESDRDWLHNSGTELVAPLTTRGGDLCGLLALGPGRSGLAYRAEDLQAVGAIAATASLALERLLLGGGQAADGGAKPGSGVAGECARCGRAVAQPGGQCGCGGEIQTAALPFELAGKFRLDRLLGSGGMGVVYRAVDLELGRSVALKTLPRLKGGALERLRREARSMATFVHPNLALLFGLESWQEVPVLVVEYLEGGSLAARLPPGLHERLALQVAADIAGALDAMHRQGLLHRDVKPENIAFAADGTPKLLDFGLAHLAAEGLAAIEAERDAVERDAVELSAEERLTRSGTVVGTPLYLSPEVALGDPPSPAQDLWSLHLVLWESLTGVHPLAKCPPHKMLPKLLSADLPFEQLGAAGASRGVVRLLAAGLSPDPKARLGTAAELRRALLEEIEGLEGL